MQRIVNLGQFKLNIQLERNFGLRKQSKRLPNFYPQLFKVFLLILYKFENI